MVFRYKPDLYHVRIFESCVQIRLPPQEREGKLADSTRAGRYVGRSDSDSLFIVFDEKKSSRVLRMGRSMVFEDLDCTTLNMSENSLDDLNDDSVIEYSVHKPEPCIEVMPEHDSVQLKAHAA